jgi:hypothetical protein
LIEKKSPSNSLTLDKEPQADTINLAIFPQKALSIELPMEKHMLGRASFLAVLLVLGCVVTAPIKAADLHGQGQSVVDGDEFMLCDSGNCIDIRLCGIDTPSKGKPGWGETIRELTRLVVDHNVLCRPVGDGSVCDGRIDGMSRGRTVAQCFTEDETVDVAASLVSAGFGCDRVDRSGGYYSKDHPDWQCKR